ncbi:MAG TPA: Uma2 family endonuclease [Candidatus Ozemobacteraceae bacterium]|nr:Uma2 family endonuclease [Candidatus Ozemobacteraceae bacterium]
MATRACQKTPENPIDRLKHERRGVTYADLLLKPDDELWEVIDGVPYLLATPTIEHQEVSVKLSRFLDESFEGQPCRVFHAPTGVFLPKKNETLDETTNFVIPDLIVVCDKAKLESRGCRGAPDLVIEILSPSSGARDQLVKLNFYEKHGVPEFWIVDPTLKTVAVFRLEAGAKRYGRPIYHDRTKRIRSPRFPGLALDLARVFPPPEKAVREPSATFSTARTPRVRKAKPKTLAPRPPARKPSTPKRSSARA